MTEGKYKTRGFLVSGGSAVEPRGVQHCLQTALRSSGLRVTQLLCAKIERIDEYFCHLACLTPEAAEASLRCASSQKMSTVGGITAGR